MKFHIYGASRHTHAYFTNKPYWFRFGYILPYIHTSPFYPSNRRRDLGFVAICMKFVYIMNVPVDMRFSSDLDIGLDIHSPNLL